MAISIQIEPINNQKRKPRGKKLDKFSHLYYIPRAVLNTVPSHKKSRAGFLTYKELSCQFCKISFHKRTGLQSHIIENHEGKNIATKKKLNQSTSTKSRKKRSLNESEDSIIDDSDISIDDLYGDISIIEDSDKNITTKKKSNQSTSIKSRKKRNLNESEDSDISIIDDSDISVDDLYGDISIIEDSDEIKVIEEFKFKPSSQSSPRKSSPKLSNSGEIIDLFNEETDVIVETVVPSKCNNKKRKTGNEDLIISFPAGEWEWMQNYPVFTPEIWLGSHVNKALRAAKDEGNSDIEMVQEKKLSSSRKRHSKSIIHGGNKRPKGENVLDLSMVSQAVNELLDLTIVDDNLKNNPTIQSNLNGSDDEVECINLE